MVELLGLASFLVGFLAFLSSLFYLVSSISLFRFYLDVGGELWFRLSLGFALLSLSQASMVFSMVVESASLSYALYTTAPALAVSGVYMIWSSRRLTQAMALTLLTLAPSSLDFVASALSALAARGFRGHARIAFTLISIAHLGRAIGTLTLPGWLPAYLLIASEALRALGALYMAIWYAKRVLV